MMKILHITPTYLPSRRYGGPIESVHGLCKGLVGHGHRVHVFTTDVDGDGYSDVPLDKEVDLDGVKVRYFHSDFLRRLYYSKTMAAALSQQIAQSDVSHHHSIFLWPTWMAARCAAQQKVPYLISPRGMLDPVLLKMKSVFAKRLWIEFCERTNFEKASSIHATSHFEYEQIQRFGIEEERICLVPNGIEADFFAKTDEIKAQRVPWGVLFLGRLSWKKGLDRLISAVALLPSAHLTVAGNDDENYLPFLKNVARDKGLGDRVNFVGPVYGANKANLLKTASVFVLPSYSENFGVAVLEAMAVGCPVVVTPEVGLADVVEGAGAGIVVEGVPEKGQNGRRIALERFIWEKVARQMETVYQSILSRSPRC
jgi:glycosyltransferase involved in cell wall biosynthesis